MESRYLLYRMLCPQWFSALQQVAMRHQRNEWTYSETTDIGSSWWARGGKPAAWLIMCFANTVKILLLWKYSGVGPLWFWIPGARWMWDPVAGIVATRIVRFLYLISEVQSSILRKNWLVIWREKIFSGWQKEKFLKIMKFVFVTSSCSH